MYLALWNETVGRPSAVLEDPQDVLVASVRAHVVASAVAVAAQVASVVWICSHALSDFEILDATADGLDDPDELVSQGHRFVILARECSLV